MDINPSAWHKVAVASKENGSGLNVAFVEDLVDTQSNSIAQLTFSTKVEEIMTKNNDIHEANFCKLIREWYEAVDEKGIKAKDRIIRLLNLREFLLDKCSTSLNRFPPPGSHICSMPSGLFSGLLISFERLIQLYRISKSGTYNVRAIGSLDNETFFSSFRDLDHRGAGVLRTTAIPKAMSIACEILTTRLNPDRGFYFTTTRKLPVYTAHCLEDVSEESTEHSKEEAEIFGNHKPFDLPRTTTAKRKRATISSYDNCPHGAQGIRQYHRKDEDKILPHKRACLNVD
ncbi:unnamed protein product [Mytilus edulis]|uniref:Uncharacterized protein n=1 Tax=Mytilus edulis TaxID=6550 RepID=A0A8S3R8F2_MYTED|nr:unnamed protein product [Mytilus edulis]